MAYIKKIKEGTETIYPATIPHAVVDPTSGKSVRTELNEKAASADLVQLESDVNLKLSSINYDNMEDGAIYPDKTSFIDVKPTNLINKNKLSSGMINMTTGGVNTSGTHHVTDYMPVDEGGSYFSKFSTYRAFYDVNKAFISSSTLNNPVIAPTGAKFARISVSNANVETEMFVKNLLPSTYIDYYDGSELSPSIKVTEESLPNTKYIQGSNIIGVEDRKSLNLFDKTKVVSGFVTGTGTIGASAGWWTSEYIPVEPNQTYKSSSPTNKAIYDSNKAFISYFNSDTLIIPANGAFARISVQPDKLDTEMFSKDALPASYVPYKISAVLVDYYLPKENLIGINLKKRWEGKYWIAIGDSIVDYVKVDENGVNTWWPNLAAEKMLISSVKRTAKPSMRMKDIAEIMTYSGTTEADLIAADLITVSLGQNDRGYALGTIGDAPSNSGDSFYAATKWLCEYLLNLNPIATIAFITPTPAVGFEAALRLRAKAIIEVCELYSIPVLDLNKMSGFNSFSFATYLSDTTHPNAKGYKRMANITASFLEQL